MKKPSILDAEDYGNLVFNSDNIPVDHVDSGGLGTLFIIDPKMIDEIDDCTVEVDPESKRATLRPNKFKQQEHAAGDSIKYRYTTSSPNNPTSGVDMSTQDRYIDARLSGIESTLDARMAAMQRFQEQADARLEKVEARFEKAEERFEASISRVESSNRSTRWTVIGTGIAVIGLVATVMYGTLTAFQQTVSEQGEAMRQSVSEQGAWLRQSVERIESTPAIPAAQADLPADRQAETAPE